LELQRQFNQFFGAKSSEFISDQLVNKAPEISSENQEIDAKYLNHLKELLNDDVNCLNSFLDEKNQIIFNALPSNSTSVGAENHKFAFTQKQIEIFAEAISKKILSIQASALVNADADKLRNIALKYESGLPLTAEEAIYLLELAQRIRPNGPLIKKKLQEYKILR
jgi:hypothetical protein